MKKLEKLSLSNIISKLTRNEMRYVMAGSGSIPDGSTITSGSEMCISDLGVSMGSNSSCVAYQSDYEKDGWTYYVNPTDVDKSC